ncbi:hypothetical protein GTQ99_18360, partial [Kineococcus sp. T13]|uniref:hypothetical protein n=1 Tax=Kineococcus vitellinus TaxID=2696565 RepID=UPI001412D04E
MAQDETAPGGARALPALGAPDGRYLGTTGRWWVELRVDAAAGGLLSADLHTTRADGRVHRLSGRGSGRPPVGRRGTRWPVRWVDGDGAGHDGWIAVAAVDDVPGSALLRAHVADGGGEGTTIAARLVRAGAPVRQLGLEVEVEAGVQAPRRVVVDGEHLDVEECLRRAGFEVSSIGVPGPVTAPPGGRWSTVDALERLGGLHAAMTAGAQADLDATAWEAHLLLLSRSDRPGLLGLMFDLEGPLPRQGAAVFVDEVRAGSEGADAERRLLQVLVHEVGHVLNLPHRFAVGRWGSTSFMNYDWCYRGGRRAAEFQRDFDWSFDDDELAFLHHGAREAVVPGGAPFGTGTDWPGTDGPGTDRPGTDGPGTDGPGTDTAHGEEDALGEGAPGLSLWLTHAGGGGPLVVAEGSPVFLEVSLANTGDGDVAVPRQALDVKGGLLEVLVGPAGGAAQAFAPIVRRCYAVDDDRVLRLRPGESLHENLNLTLGSAGEPFAAPGRWRVRPLLHLPSGAAHAPGTLVRGEDLEVDVEEPSGEAAGRLTGLARRPGVRTALALGAAGGREEVRRAVQACADGPAPGALVAAAQRVRGLELARAAGDRTRGGARQRAAGASREDLEEARARLQEALDSGGRVFDPHTREHTRRLAAACGEAAGGAPAPRAVVELGTEDGGVLLCPGAPLGDRSGFARRVLVRLTGLPAQLPQGWVDGWADAGRLRAAVVVAGPDGLS